MPRVNSQTPSFASVEELKNASIRPSELALRGKVKVGGNEYQVRLMPSGEYQVNRQDSGKLGFFKATKELFSHRLSEGSLGSRSSAIADVLNSKRSAAESAGFGVPGWATPQRRPAAAEASSSAAPPPYATPPRGGLAQKLMGGMQGNATPETPSRYVHHSLLDLATEMAKEHKKTPWLNDRQIYSKITSNIPQGLQKLDKPQLHALVSTMAKTCDHYEGRLLTKSQFTDGAMSYIPYSDTAKRIPHKAESANIRFERIREKAPTNLEENPLARITINVKPEYAAQLGKAMAHLVAHTPHIGAKLIAPSSQGARTESGIIYMPPNFEQAKALTSKLRQMLPPDAFVEHKTIGMHPVARGLSYAESSVKDSEVGGSYGKARAAIIEEAIKDKGPGKLEQRLLDAFERHGYSRENPAFLATSKLPA
ncbi:T3SS effector HopA1 family protein [Pokkaliibacter plantistimulans]|uniref:T3SS effector HopA1 family protein n=1 Tax=Pokkaliibacter plantistimulans TaxID=1635171 RepID=UPI000D74B37C|nr:T3SS effector HopA1 family protein [Pokkaliibacter plantistimulans]